MRADKLNMEIGIRPCEYPILFDGIAGSVFPVIFIISFILKYFDSHNQQL